MDGSPLGAAKVIIPTKEWSLLASVAGRYSDQGEAAMARSLLPATGRPNARPQNIETPVGDSAPVDGSFGIRLREIRMSSGLSEAQLAERLQIGSEEIRDYERGKKRLDVDLLLDIARALGVRPDYFFRFSDEGQHDALENDEGAWERADIYPTLIDQGLRLQRAFVRIQNTRVRASIVDLVVEVARSHGAR